MNDITYYFDIEGKRDKNMIEDINNVCIMLKYMAMNKDNLIVFGNNIICIMDRDLNILSPMHRCEFKDEKLVEIDKEIGNKSFCICMNGEINWKILLETSRKLSNSDEWEKIKTEVSSMECLTRYNRKRTEGEI